MGSEDGQQMPSGQQLGSKGGLSSGATAPRGGDTVTEGPLSQQSGGSSTGSGGMCGTLTSRRAYSGCRSSPMSVGAASTPPRHR